MIRKYRRYRRYFKRRQFSVRPFSKSNAFYTKIMKRHLRRPEYPKENFKVVSQSIQIQHFHVKFEPQGIDLLQLSSVSTFDEGIVTQFSGKEIFNELLDRQVVKDVVSAGMDSNADVQSFISDTMASSFPLDGDKKCPKKSLVENLNATPTDSANAQRNSWNVVSSSRARPDTRVE